MAVTPARTVREAMHEGCECIGESQSLLDAAKRMEELDVGVLPICGDDDRLKGMLTDRDIVVKGIAQARDPSSTSCSELAQGTVRWIGADASLDDALSMMREHAIKRLCVLDDDKELVSITDKHGNTITMDKDGIKLESGKDLKLTASGNVEIKGAKVDVK